MTNDAGKVDVLAVMDRLIQMSDVHLQRRHAGATGGGDVPRDEQAREARDAVAELIEAAKESRGELQSCQAAMHLAGDFDPAYIKGAQASIKRTDAALARMGGGNNAL